MSMPIVPTPVGHFHLARVLDATAHQDASGSPIE